MHYNYNEANSNADIKDSLTRQEEAYINSSEYKCIEREKNWLVIGLVTTWLAVLLVVVFI
jgi:hypothetical protein